MRHSILVAAMICGAAAPAQAQFKKLKGAVTRAVPQVVSMPGAPNSGGVRTADLQFDDRVLEITPERIERLIKGIESGMAMEKTIEAQDIAAIDRANAEAKAAYDKDYNAYKQRKDAWEKCSEKQMAGVQQQMTGTGAVPSEADQARLEGVSQRMKAAKEKGDMAEVRRLMDSITKALTPGAMQAAAIGNAAPAKVVAACGQRPEEPARPARQDVIGYDAVDRAEIEASGLTDVQYHILRERVAPFVATGGKSSPLVYTETEIGVLKEAQAKLETYVAYFKKY